MPKLPIKALPAGDSGRLLVRLNHAYRGDIGRYDIARIRNTANGESKMVLVLGHDDEDAVFMPYDIRVALGVEKGGELDFSIEKVGLLGKLVWYVNPPDPAVSIPAWIAIVGLGLGVVGLLIGVVTLVCPSTS
ncbi:hypothetical protein [Sphingomonas sp.]|uniref:hypothetical protein n=1 Tax=Sphingomonas sp. TaxID=28214 RepID=UPI003D6D4F67